MALTDYRTLIDQLHDRPDGRPLMAYVEIVATNAAERFLKPIEIGIIREDTGIDLRLALDESEAGALFDAIGGALQALATPDAPVAPRIAITNTDADLAAAALRIASVHHRLGAGDGWQALAKDESALADRLQVAAR